MNKEPNVEDHGEGPLLHVVRAFGYSMKGLRAAWHHEMAFRIEVVLFVLMIPAGLWLGTDPIRRVLLIGSAALVLVVELLNSALEAAVDRFGPEHHELVGRAKDLGSSAVFVTLVGTGVLWVVLLVERFAGDG